MVTNSKYILFFFLFYSCLYLPAQNTKTDSLLILLKKDKEDTDKVTHLNALGWKLMYNNPDTAIIIGNQALLIAAKLTESTNKTLAKAGKRGVTVSLGQMGVYQALKANYAKALEYYLKALKEAEDLGDKKLYANTLNNIGNVYNLQGDYPKTLEYYLKALKIDEELGDKNRIALVLGNMGNVYYVQVDYLKALDYFLKALKINEELGNKNRIALVLGNIANVYSDQAVSSLTSPAKRGELQSKALNYYFKALKIDEEIGDKNSIGAILNNVGNIFEAQGDSAVNSGNTTFAMINRYPQALNYYSNALKMDAELDDKNGMATVIGSIGSLFTKTGKYNDAYNYLYRSLAISDSIGANDIIKSRYNGLSYLYERSTIPLPDTIGGKILNKEGMRLRALYYFKRYLDLRDTIFSEENKKQLVRKEMNYEFDKKEALTKAEHEKQVAVAAAENRRQQIFIWLVALVALAIGIIALIITRSLRITRRQKNIMGKQKELIEKKNKQITDSINYAQRIQNNLMPDPSGLSAVFPNSFIFLQPKDVVSGDFYWYKQIDNYFYLCVADCTGHGVPGAFMSIIGIDAIEQAIIDKQVSEPAAILNFINHAVLSKTQIKDATEVVDGMDMVFVRFDLTNKKLVIAGARNPLIIMRDGAIIEIKTDKISVGQLKENNSFSQFEIDYKQNDNLYLFSDGYADQKGGPHKKKFMMPEFRKLLIETSAFTNAEQRKENLKTALANWMDDHHQIDDVLVVGVKID